MSYFPPSKSCEWSSIYQRTFLEGRLLFHLQYTRLFKVCHTAFKGTYGGGVYKTTHPYIHTSVLPPSLAFTWRFTSRDWNLPSLSLCRPPTDRQTTFISDEGGEEGRSENTDMPFSESALSNRNRTFGLHYRQ